MIANYKTSFMAPLGGVQSKEFLEDRVNHKPIILRR
jgi:hypothetical protein